jgi:uncharacterized protein YceK
MRQYSRTVFPLLLIFFVIGSASCATVRTVPSLATPEQPKIYSGTRLDLHAISKNEEALKKFDAKSPEHPLIDLPFSALLDTLLLPVTFPVACYELIFGL